MASRSSRAAVPLQERKARGRRRGLGRRRVDQDDIVASMGSAGFEAPPSRSDRVLVRGVRLPWVKFPGTRTCDAGPPPHERRPRTAGRSSRTGARPLPVRGPRGGRRRGADDSGSEQVHLLPRSRQAGRVGGQGHAHEGADAARRSEGGRLRQGHRPRRPLRPQGTCVRCPRRSSTATRTPASPETCHGPGSITSSRTRRRRRTRGPSRSDSSTRATSPPSGRRCASTAT